MYMGLLSSLFGSNAKTDFKQLLENGAIVVDVRSRDEFAGGHVNNSINIPLPELSAQIAALKKKNKVIITCCQSGARSSMAKSQLGSAGITAYNGGGWRSLQAALR